MDGNKQSLSSNERHALMSNVQQQMAIEQAQTMLQQISEKCFKMCITKPSSSLSSSEQVNK
jgi:import inner membrane translocase subunit TIM13